MEAAKVIEGEVSDPKPRAVARRQDSPSLAPANDAASLMAVISRAASDPAVDINKLERLMTMHDGILKRQAEQAFNEAMTKAQSEMRRIATDSANPQTKSRYASYAALDRIIRPIYTGNGFALTFDTGEGAPEGYVRIVCDVLNGGFTRHYHIDMPADGKGAKGGDVMTKTHATGSAATYGRRYLLTMIFNLAVGQDDDGNAAARQPKDAVSDDAADKMRETVAALVAEMKMPIENFLKWAKAESISDIPGADLPDVIANLQERKRKLAEKKGASQ